jgi:hypothetical protein
MELRSIIREIASTAASMESYNAMQGGEDYDASITIRCDLPPFLVAHATDGELTLRGSATTLRLIAALLEERDTA